MLLRECPNCGASNSDKRTTCYRCQRPLGAAPPDPPNTTQEAAPRAASRWQALEIPRERGARVVRLRPKPASPQAESAPAAAARAAPVRPAAFVPRGRSSIRHVRRMAIFYRQFHTLVRAGINVINACHELETKAPWQFRGVAREMAAAAAAGKPVSAVLERHRSIIYPWHLGVIRAAELAGVLPDALDQIARAYEVEWQTRAEIGLRLFFYSAFVIPAMLINIPVIKFLNAPFPKDGWTPQTAIAWMVHELLTTSVPIGVGIVAAVIGWQLLGAVPWFQALQQRLVMTIPLIGRVSKLGALERYLATLGVLLQGGVSVTDATEHAAMAAGNVVLTPRLLRVSKAVQQGQPLTQALLEARAFEAETLQLAGTGEMTGSLPEMLGRASGYYRERHEAARRNLIRLLFVAFTVFFGIIVGMMVIKGALSYFDYMFRGLDWMMQGT
jgi:type II secretory pathway component PulF